MDIYICILKLEIDHGDIFMRSIRRIILHEKGGFILSCSTAYPPLGRTSDPGRVEGWILWDVNVRKFSTLLPL